MNAIYVACCVENAPMIGGLPTIQGARGGGIWLELLLPLSPPTPHRPKHPPPQIITLSNMLNTMRTPCGANIYFLHILKKKIQKCVPLYILVNKMKNSYMYISTCNIDLLCVMRIFPGTQSWFEKEVFVTQPVQHSRGCQNPGRNVKELEEKNTMSLSVSLSHLNWIPRQKCANFCSFF